LAKFFECAGVLETLTGRIPFLLNDPCQVRMVMSGVVDVFFVQIEGGNPAGPRHHCMTAEPGELLFGISVEEGFGLLAVSAGQGEVRRCSVSEFERMSRLPDYSLESASLLDGWIAGLTLGAMTDELKVADVELEPDVELTLDEDKSVRARNSVVWVELPRNCGLFMDRKMLGSDERLTAIPVTNRAWMWVQPSGSLTLRTYATGHMLGQPDFWQHLRRFHDTYIACARLRIISFEWEEKEGQQRVLQRLMIARALAGNSRILLFDEATSALDNRTQAVVSRSIESLRLTRIVIALRLSTVINAGRIYVLSQGRVVLTGTYADLMAQEGLFKQLANRQVI
jgi:hypothetical protein